MAAEAAVADVGPPLGAEETQTATLGLTGGGARTGIEDIHALLHIFIIRGAPLACRGNKKKERAMWRLLKLPQLSSFTPYSENKLILLWSQFHLLQNKM